MTPIEHLRNFEMRYYTLFRIENGRGFYIIDDKLYTRKEFEKMFPAGQVIRAISDKFKGNNISRIQKWFYED